MSRPRCCSAAARCARLRCWHAARIADATGAKLLCETFPARLERGAGLPAVERLGYLAEFAVAQMQGSAAPRAASTLDRRFRSSRIPASRATSCPRAARSTISFGYALLEALAGALGAPAAGAQCARGAARAPDRAAQRRDDRERGRRAVAGGRDRQRRGNTAGLFVSGATAGAPRHDWLTLTGGAIGQGMPVATGAAVACPDRKVLSLEADGSAMYTLQSLWTQAREGLDVTTVIFNNRSYAILNLELSRVGAPTDGNAADLFDLSRPPLDFVALARGMGVDGRACRDRRRARAPRSSTRSPSPALDLDRRHPLIASATNGSHQARLCKQIVRGEAGARRRTRARGSPRPRRRRRTHRAPRAPRSLRASAGVTPRARASR